ncbi:MAG: 3-deoxy-8-phosphooctulonate synthase [Pyramidobacter sp.]|jgi:2-dehydro-3-deoxyphosphooctonate aldolase (KDO 8-P synthase)
MKKIKVADFEIGGDRLTVIAGPCTLESLELGLEVGRRARDLCRAYGMNYIFKASFDKANRTSISSPRGPGIDCGLQWLAEIRSQLGVPVLTDIHEPWQAERAAEAVDVLQIPAFLCRQTDLLIAAAKTGRAINVKKAQFLSPWDMKSVLGKLQDSGNDRVMLCERGTTMGYNQLVVDMRSLVIMRSLGVPVVFDATHSVQMPGGMGNRSGGDRRFTLPLARAALAIGVDALFMEVHPHPEKALSDGPNMVPLNMLEYFLKQVAAVDGVVRSDLGAITMDWCEQ